MKTWPLLTLFVNLFLDFSISSTTVDLWPDNIQARQGQTTSLTPWCRRYSANQITRVWDRLRSMSLWCNSHRSCRFSRLRQCCLSNSSSTCRFPWWNLVADRCSSRYNKFRVYTLAKIWSNLSIGNSGGNSNFGVHLTAQIIH